jgi:hypothetical protein
MHLTKAMSTPAGSIIISVILGLGLAALFRKVCHGDGCVVIKAPDASDLQKFVYRIGGGVHGNDASCFKYTPEDVPCPMKAIKRHP